MKELRDISVSFQLGLERRINLETDRLPRTFIPAAINNNGLVLGMMDRLPCSPTRDRRSTMECDSIGSAS